MSDVPDRGDGAEPPTGAAADDAGSEARSQPRPEPAPHWRTRFRGWRRSRPFWAGLWTGIAGVEMALIPLSDIGRFLSSGQAAFTAALPGIILVIAAAFMWFSPPNRTMAGLLAMVFAVASLVLSNLGGLLIGMMLGIVGGAMAIGWTDAPRKKSRSRSGKNRTERGASAVLLLVVVALLTLPVSDRADARTRCLLDDPTAEVASTLAQVAVDLLGLDGDRCLVSVDDLATIPLRDILGDLEPALGIELLREVSAADVLANVSGLDSAEAGSVITSLTDELGLTVAAADGGPTGADLLEALAEALADDGVTLDIPGVIAVLEETVAGVPAAGELLSRLLDLIGDTVDDVLDSVPALDPGDDAEAPPPTDARVAAVEPTAVGHDQNHVAPSVVSDLLLDTLDVDTLRYDGIVTVTTGDGPLDVMRFVIDEIDATGLDLILPDGRTADFGIANTSGGSLNGTGVVLDCTRLSLTVTSAAGLPGLPIGLPIELYPGAPLLGVLGPVLNGAPAGTVLSTNDVDIDLITLSVESLDLLGIAGGAS